VTEFHATEAQYSLGLTSVKYNTRRLYSEEKDKVSVRINPQQPYNPRGNVIYLLVKTKFRVCKHTQILYAVRSCD